MLESEIGYLRRSIGQIDLKPDEDDHAETSALEIAHCCQAI